MPERGPEAPLRITRCPFPPKTYAELRAQRLSGLNATETPASIPPAISIITTSEGGCQYGGDLNVIVGQGKLRQCMT